MEDWTYKDYKSVRALEFVFDEVSNNQLEISKICFDIVCMTKKIDSGYDEYMDEKEKFEDRIISLRKKPNCKRPIKELKKMRVWQLKNMCKDLDLTISLNGKLLRKQELIDKIRAIEFHRLVYIYIDKFDGDDIRDVMYYYISKKNKEIKDYKYLFNYILKHSVILACYPESHLNCIEFCKDPHKFKTHPQVTFEYLNDNQIKLINSYTQPLLKLWHEFENNN